jgi:hypothetical protein
MVAQTEPNWRSLAWLQFSLGTVSLETEVGQRIMDQRSMITCVLPNRQVLSLGFDHCFRRRRCTNCVDWYLLLEGYEKKSLVTWFNLHC